MNSEVVEPEHRSQVERHDSDGIVMGRSCSTLNQLWKPHVCLAIWRRRLPAYVHDALRLFIEQNEWDYKNEIRAGHEPWAAIVPSGLRADVREWLIVDIGNLTRACAELSGHASLCVEFSVVKDNRCSKFHTDVAPLRLVSTYVGPGTEWLPADAVNWELVYHPTEATSNASIMRNPGALQQASTGDVLLFRGTRFNHRDPSLPLVPHAPLTRPVVHRSPTIKEKNIRRLILVVTANHIQQTSRGVCD